jgi:hypothetical protein
VPEGFQAGEALDKFKAAAKEAGLDSAKAQKLFDVYVGQEQARAATQQKQVEASLAQVRKSWQDAVKSDPVIGGANVEQTRLHAMKAMKAFATPELHKVLAGTGFGDHPEFIRFMAQVGKAMGEDSIQGTSSQGLKTPANNAEAFQRALYPKSPQMFSKE